MNNLYLYLDLGVIVFPFLLSFDQKVHYVGDWKWVAQAIFVIGLPFLIHDYFFTEMKVWGFDADYLTGVYLLNLPIEEVLFFVVVPFACLFIYQCCVGYFQREWFQPLYAIFILGMMLYALVVLLVGLGAWYSTMVSATALALLAWLRTKQTDYPFLPIAFLLSMIPFFIMNSILTGAITPEPIVWYDNLENVNFRWGTIPIEDVLYSFILIAGNIIFFEGQKNKAKNRS